jgi:ribonuclease J
MSRTKHLRIVPLGGLGEIGKNMTAFEIGQDAIIIDTGIMFPANDMHGIDYIIPDFNYLVQRSDLKIHAILFTHGHEDHIGAVQHVVAKYPKVPLYATGLTAGIIELKLAEAGLRDTDIKIFKAGDHFNLGPFKIEAFHMCHSIPDCVGFAIDTPFGLIVHTGDYKFDNTPVDGRKPDYARLASYGQRGVKLLMADSTNAEREGWTGSESSIEAAFERVFREAKGRIMVATFATLISRIQQAANVAQKLGRRMVINGHSMREYVKMARQMKYLDIPESMILDPGKIGSVEPHKLVMMVTGSQGEPSSVLTKMSIGKHRYLDVKAGDTIVLSSHPIPGNEESVSRTINRLMQRGAQVVYEPLEKVHVSGHASRDEMRLMIHLTQPQWLLPIHGELRHLKAHAQLGIEAGVPPNHVIVVENGNVIEVDKHQVRVGERVQGGYVFVDGGGTKLTGRAVIHDREILSRDGFLLVSVNIDKKTGALLKEPDIISRGFVFVREADELMDTVRENVYETLRTARQQNGRRQQVLEDSISRVLYNETRRRPMVFAIVNEI